METKQLYLDRAMIFDETGIFIEPEDPLDCMNVLLDVLIEELENA